MRSPIALCAALCALALALALPACSSSTRQRSYSLQGQVLEIAPDREQAVIKHDEIKGLMPAMTMPYKVIDRSLLKDITPGDLVSATLVIVSNDAYLSELKKIGQAPLEQRATKPSASSGFELLKMGQEVPDVELVNQDGRTEKFSSLRGGPVAVTFMYTSCPLPTFCPLMDRHFATVQKELAKDPKLARVHLVSISFDPITDTPAVLKKHAKELGADPARWTFFTGNRDDIDQFGARFGMTIARALDDPLNITHNLRTVIIDAEGKVVKVYTGNEWTPTQVLADLRAIS